MASVISRALPAGADSVLIDVRVDDAGAEAAVAAVAAVAQAARARAGGDWTAADIVPGAATVLIDGVAGISPGGLAAEVSGWDVAPLAGGDGPSVDVPIVFDGPDLEDVARLWGVDARAVVERLLETEQRVAFSGFAPGFAYLTGLPEQWAVPRRASPRTRVPAGSLGLAGAYAGIYPRESPGGWQLVGRAVGVTLWDEHREPPALLAPGTRVRLVEAPHDVADHPAAEARDRAGATGERRSSSVAAGARGLEVVRAGTLTTIQDAGRPGHAHLGVPRSGAADGPARALANALVGNEPGAAVLETTHDGCAVRVTAPAVVAVTGAPAPVWVGDVPAPHGAPIRLGAGQTLEVGAPDSGLRSYLAVRGGIAVEAVLGSRSTDVLSGLGPAPLRDGDAVALGDGAPLDHDGFARLRAHAAAQATGERDPANASAVCLTVTPGPRDDWFTPAAVELLRGATYEVSGDSNRVGVRLSGPALERATSAELPSEGMVLGAIQVPPSGQPVIFLADHPTTGGYPVIGVLDAASVARAAQLRPGDRVRFA